MWLRAAYMTSYCYKFYHDVGEISHLNQSEALN